MIGDGAFEGIEKTEIAKRDFYNAVSDFIEKYGAEHPTVKFIYNTIPGNTNLMHNGKVLCSFAGFYIKHNFTANIVDKLIKSLNSIESIIDAEMEVDFMYDSVSYDGGYIEYKYITIYTYRARKAKEANA